MKVKGYFIAVLIVAVAFSFSAGCAGDAGYSVTAEGVLSYEISELPYEKILSESCDNFSVWDIVLFDDVSGTAVYGVLVSPPDPGAGIIFVPGAGVKAVDHLSRGKFYAENGIAFLALDIRGNGGQTEGYPLDFAKDYELFLEDEWPQYYLIVRDISEARTWFSGEEFPGIPVYAMGSSNGGRYSALAASADPGFAGYIGVSTSAFEIEEENFDGKTLKFLRSVDPGTYISRISPRPVWIFHAEGDEIIPFSMGQDFFGIAGEPKEFIALNGSTHGMSSAVDDYVIYNILKP